MLNTLIKQLGFKQKDLSKRVGLCQSTISQYANNKRTPKPEIMLKLAEVLNVDVEVIIKNFCTKN